MADWEALFARMNVGTTTVPKPTTKDLDQFENEFTFRLPESYREFIQVFGPGRMTREFDIAAPGYPHKGDSVDLALLNKATQEVFSREINLRTYSTDELAWIRRLIYFCTRRNGDLIGWDPTDLQNVARHEYGVYSFGRSHWMKRIARSFEEFIEKVCLGKKHLNNPHWDEAELGPIFMFDPAVD